MTITFPHMGNMYICVKALLDSLKINYIMPDFNIKSSLEKGASIAPETACLPLKIHLGNFIQAYEKGADTILMAGGHGPCRLGYYCEMYREILNDNGYKYDVVTLEKPKGNWKCFFSDLRNLCRDTNVISALLALRKTVETAVMADRLERMAYYLRPREYQRGQINALCNEFKRDILKASGWKELRSVFVQAERHMSRVELDPAAKPLRVGIVGEIYTTIDSNSSFNLDVVLGEMGVEVHREVTVSNWIIEHILKGVFHMRKDLSFAQAAKPYLPAMIGGHARETIGHSVMYGRAGFDGIIQIYPLTCMPEIVAQSILPSVSHDFNIPVLTLIVDELTGEAGYITRLEAFVDMLANRRENGISN